MKAQIFALCDKAFFDSEKKLNIIGSFDIFHTPEVPSAAVKVCFGGTITDGPSRGEGEASIKLVNPKSKKIVETSFKITFGETGVGSFVAKTDMIPLNEFGAHKAELSINAKKIAEITYYVEKTKN